VATLSDQSLSVAIIGSGGAGVLTTGLLLLDAVAAAGRYALMRRASGPQIRGGESAALLRISDRPVFCDCGHVEVLLALDWRNADRFMDELHLHDRSIVIYDSGAGEPPRALAVADSGRLIALPFTDSAKSIDHGRTNMVALGLLAAMIGIPPDIVDDVVATGMEQKGPDTIRAGQAAASAGAAFVAQLDGFRPPAWPEPAAKTQRWNISGNEACALGALRGGVRFCAAYPITPASEMLEWLAPRLEKIGGTLLQAEDELASINMCIGASYGGVPAMTATSGPGFALMVESLGLAVAAEVPVVVIDVMRGGPSTGIPTKSEQADLNIAIYGMHGDAPHIVLAPLSIDDGLFTTQWAVHLAESLQVPAVVLTDQAMAQARAVIDRPVDVSFVTRRTTAGHTVQEYQRYAISAGGVSPMAIPGTAGVCYTAEGLEHNERGTPTARAADHAKQLEKRRSKIVDHDYGGAWADHGGSGDTAVITWGSTTAAVREAIEQLGSNGKDVRLIGLRLLAPFPEKAFASAMVGARCALIVEQSHSQQFYRYLRAHADLPRDTRVLSRPGPVPIRPHEIIEQLGNWS